MAEVRPMNALLTVDEAAQFLRVGKSALYRLVESRDESVRLPAVRIGQRRLRFRLEDLEQWVEERAR
jgi:excisionase family DNA binding protein